MSKKVNPSEKIQRPGNSKNKNSIIPKSPDSKWLWLGAILLITFITFLPSLNCAFTAWDDHLYVTESDLIKNLSFENIKRIFSTESIVALNYHPLTILSLAIDYHFSKLNPFQYHAVNIFLHLLNTMLVFLLVYRISGKKIYAAILVSLFFGIHPMHVESVTWIAERKDVLYTWFFLLGLQTYLSFLETKKTSFLLTTFLLFFLSVLSKAMAVIFPLVMLLIDYYNGRKINLKVIAEKIPFIIISLLFGFLAVNIQSSGAIASYETFSLAERIGFGFYGFITYIWKLFLPVNQSAFYPYPNANIDGTYPASFFVLAISGIILFILLVTLSIVKKDRMKTISFGAGFYFITIMMVLQFISVGGVIIAERYSYVPYIGLLFPIGMAMNNAIEKKRSSKNLILIITMGIALVFSFITHERIKVWNNAETLWTDVIEKYPFPPWHIEIPYEGRGKYYAVKKNDPEKALADYNTLLLMKTKNPANYNNLGNLYGSKALEFEKSGDSIKASELYYKSIEYFSTSISIDSTVVSTYTNRGLLYIYLKKYDLAAADYIKALSLEPDNIELKEKRAYIYYLCNKREEAIRDYDELIAVNPSKTLLFFLRGIARANSGKAKEAIEDFRIVVEREPQNGDAFFNLSISEKQIGDNENALIHAEKAIQCGRKIDPLYLEQLKAGIKK